MGSRMTRSPSRRIRTSVCPSNRNSFGRRTAWLPPCLNNFARVSFGVTSLVYTRVATVAMSRVRFVRERERNTEPCRTARTRGREPRLRHATLDARHRGSSDARSARRRDVARDAVVAEDDAHRDERMRARRRAREAPEEVLLHCAKDRGCLTFETGLVGLDRRRAFAGGGDDRRGRGRSDGCARADGTWRTRKQDSRKQQREWRDERELHRGSPRSCARALDVPR